MVKCTDFYGRVHLVSPKDLIKRLSAYGIYIDDGKVLLIQDPRSLRWELPGGGIEKGETIQEAVKREFIEEIGVTPLGEFIFLTEWIEYFFNEPTQEAWRSKRKFYLIRTIEGSLLEHGNGDDSGIAKLVPVDKVHLLDITPSIQKVIKIASNKVTAQIT